MKHHRPFLALWVLAVGASVLAFVLHLAMRGKTMSLGYELGRVRAEQAHLREVKRVLQLEVASYQTPQRVEVVARTVLHMEPPAAERIISMPAMGAPRVATDDTAATATTGDRAVPRTAARGRDASRGAASAAPVVSAPPLDLIVPRVTPPKSAGGPASSATPPGIAP